MTSSVSSNAAAHLSKLSEHYRSLFVKPEDSKLNADASPAQTEKTASSASSSSYYWAKGTGYGTDYSDYSWDASSFAETDRQVSEVFQGLIAASLAANEFTHEHINCLSTVLLHLLRNDSLVDMEKHAVLYKSVFRLLQKLATAEMIPLVFVRDSQLSPIFQQVVTMPQLTSTELAPLVNEIVREPELSPIFQQLVSLRTQAEAIEMKHSVLLKKFSNLSVETSPEEAFSSFVITTVREIEDAVYQQYPALRAEALSEEVKDKVLADACDVIVPPQEKTTVAEPELQVQVVEAETKVDEARMRLSIDYCKALQPLMFDEVDGFTQHHFMAEGNESEVTRQFIRRVACEYADLAQSLPLTRDSSVFMRIDANNTRLSQFMVAAPSDTPYAGGLFLFDMKLLNTYPNAPPKVNLQTTGHGTVRFNPNLYDSGYVCLSLLGTWEGQEGEGWIAGTSTMLQVLVSVQSLIFVPSPYFNEPGVESSIHDSSSQQASEDYNRNIEQATVKWAMLEMLKSPPKGFEEVVRTHFYLRQDEILGQVQKWAEKPGAFMGTMVEELKAAFAELTMPKA